MSESFVAPVPDREWPSRCTAERVALDEWLDFERATLLTKCASLTSEQLKRRAVPPSALSLLGLVRHMSEVERWWFRRNANGEQLEEIHCRPDAQDADFDEVDDADAEADLAVFHAEIDAAKQAVAGHALDEEVQSAGHHPDIVRNIRWIYIHMIEEYARHNGHADLLRELVDGATGE
jgi:uncharacterized damage-inducible protein DinB